MQWVKALERAFSRLKSDKNALEKTSMLLKLESFILEEIFIERLKWQHIVWITVYAL